MSIELLSDEIINQIAAGEVIESPSAVVKELVENSIDSGADEIEISIVNSGLDKIQITDNGCGISKEDLLKAPLRHATSKIKSFNDLYNISTMGFRGEALASIFSISDASIKSKFDNETFEIKSNDISTLNESSCKSSTTITVENLFYNTPARKKYLKSEALEFKAIIDIVNRFEVFYHNIKFVLKHNSKTIVNKPKFESKLDNLYYVLGKDLKDNLFEFNEKINGIKVYGFISKPSNLTYSFRKNQYLYVNNRYIQSKLIRDAIYEGYSSNLMTGRHPFYVLFIDIDPEIIDCNVHPTKIEIKFENELEIYEFISNVIKKQFETKESFKEFEVKEENKSLNEIISEVEDTIRGRVYNEPKEIDKSKYYSSEKQSHFDVVNEDNIEFNRIKKVEINELDEKLGPLGKELNEYKILGQLNKTYIIVETPKELLLVDQHVCEEKYYFEKFKEMKNSSQNKSQMLLKPELIHLTNSEMILFEENFDLMKQIGFDCNKFGDNEVKINSVPINIRNEILTKENLRDMLYNILINKKIKCVEEENNSKLASMACRISIMAGDELTMPQMKRMIENLKRLKQPFNCPHGRPTFLKYSYYELDKKFKRII